VIALDPPSAPARTVAQDDDRLLSTEEEETSVARSAASAPAAPAAPAKEVDLLGDDLLGLGLGPAPAAAPAAAAAKLAPVARLEPEAFQERWGRLPAGAPLNMQAQRMPSSAAEIDGAARSAFVFSVASGDKGAALVWYLYAQTDPDRAFHLGEASLNKTSGLVSVIIKSENPQAVGAFLSALRATFGVIGAT
jgi:hypothetical protein